MAEVSNSRKEDFPMKKLTALLLALLMVLGCCAFAEGG